MAAGAAPPCPASRSSAERARAKREIGVGIAESPPAVSGRECGRCRQQRLGLIHEAIVTAAISAAKQPRCLSTTSPGPPMPQNAAKDEKGEGRTSRQDGDEDQAVEMLPEHSTGPCRLRHAHAVVHKLDVCKGLGWRRARHTFAERASLWETWRSSASRRTNGSKAAASDWRLNCCFVAMQMRPVPQEQQRR